MVQILSISEKQKFIARAPSRIRTNPETRGESFLPPAFTYPGCSTDQDVQAATSWSGQKHPKSVLDRATNFEHGFFAKAT